MMDDVDVYFLTTGLYPEEPTLVKVREGSNRKVEYVYVPALGWISAQVAVSQVVDGLTGQILSVNLVGQALVLVSSNPRILLATRRLIDRNVKSFV